jgi:hypothetical protein
MTIEELFEEENNSKPKQEIHNLRKETRYLIIVQVNHDGKVYSSSNKIPITDLKKAKEIAVKCLPKNLSLTKEDYCVFKGFKYIYADVPIKGVVSEDRYEMQCVLSKSLTEEELKQL